MPHIRKVYDELLELERELASLRQLVQKERQDIVQLDFAGLHADQIGIEAALGRINPLNARLTSDIDEACRLCGVEGDRTLSPLIGAIPKPDREEFARIQKGVQGLSSMVENDLAINRALLRDSLEFTNKSLGFFSSTIRKSAPSTYGSQGRFIDATDQPRIICKEI